MAGKKDAFISIGLSVSKANETLKNTVLADKLYNIIEEVSHNLSLKDVNLQVIP